MKVLILLSINLELQVQTISYEDLSAQLMDEEKCLMESVGPALKSERQSEDLYTAAALFVKLKGQVYRSCNQRGHISRNRVGNRSVRVGFILVRPKLSRSL